MKEGKAPALGDWVGGMAAPGGRLVPQVEEGRESSLPSRRRLIPKSGCAYEAEPGTGLILLSGGSTGSSPFYFVCLRPTDFGNLPFDGKIRHI